MLSNIKVEQSTLEPFLLELTPKSSLRYIPHSQLYSIEVNDFRNLKNQNVENGLQNLNQNSKEKKLSLESIDLITLKAFLKNYMPLKFSLLNIPNGLER